MNLSYHKIKRKGISVICLSAILQTTMREKANMVPVSQSKQVSGASGRAVERRTVNRGDGGSIPPAAVSKLKLLSHIHDFYQDLNTTKLDLRVVLGRAASWQNIQICVKRKTVIRSSYDSYTAHYDDVRYLYDGNTTCIRPVKTVT